MINPYQSLIDLLLSVGFFCLGWALRSFQFATDQECANPEHNDEDTTNEEDEP